MKLKELELAGFRGFRDAVQIPLAPGFTVITGRNGSGKSSVCDAIEYVISGQLSRFAPSDVEGGERIGDYLWWRDGTEPTARKIRARFELDSGGIAECTATPKGLDRNFPNELFYDAESHPPEPLTRLCQTALIRDESIVRLSTDIPEADRFELFYKAIGLADLSAIEQRAHRLYEQLRERSRHLENEYRVRRDRVAHVISDLSETRILASKSTGSDVTKTQRRLAALAGAATDLPLAQLATASQRSATAERVRLQRLERLRLEWAQSEAWLAELAVFERASRDINERIKTAQAALREAARLRDEAVEQLRSAQSQNQTLASVAQLREQGLRLGLNEGRCPLCGTPVSKEDFEKHLAEIERNIERHSETLNRLSAEEADRTTAYAARLSEHENLSRQHRHAIAEFETRKGNLRSLEELAMSLGVGLEADTITAALEACQSRIRELEVGLAEFEASTAFGRVGDLDKQRLLAEQDVESLAKEMERFSAAAQNAKAAEDAARRVSWEAVDDSMAALSPLLSELYFRLKPHMDYAEVRYKMRGDVKRFLSFAVGSDINPRFTFSSGQRRALGLAFLLAVHLSRPWCNLKTLVLDDPVQHIDDYRALRFAEVLSSIRQMGQQVICTVEDPELADLLCRRLRSFAIGDGLRIDLEYEPGSGARVKEVRQIAPLPGRLLLSA
jgi:chromosome segregation protein